MLGQLLFTGSACLIAENILLRQQLIILKRSATKPSVTRRDRLVLVVLSRFYSKWKETLLIIKPETVIRWHRQGFRLFWKWKTKVTRGRKKISDEMKNLIDKMAQENPLWGAPRIRAELRLLGHDVAISTVALYLKHKKKPPSQPWRTFLKNHAEQIAGIDFFTVPTLNFKVVPSGNTIQRDNQIQTPLLPHPATLLCDGVAKQMHRYLEPFCWI